MASEPAQIVAANLAMHEGRALYSAADALLKGLLESDREVSLITGSEGSFGQLFATARMESVQELLRKHGTAVFTAPSARRSLMIAMRSARAGNCAVNIVPNNQLHSTLGEITEAASMVLAAGTASHPLAGDGEQIGDAAGGLVIVFEDDPQGSPSMCPRQIVRAMGLPCIEPATLTQLRDAMDQAVRLSRAGASAVAVIVHHSLLRATVTLEARPNRVVSPVDAPLLKRRRRQKLIEAGGVLRMARRMELNRVRALPSPGERVAVGFITIGPADAALQHLTQTLRLHGRVPVLYLGLLHPIDEVLVERFLTRCEHVVVLEARPGNIQAALLVTTEILRQRAVTPASIWGRMVPPSGDDAPRTMRADESIHVSMLARKIVHLLHPLRPALQVGSKLAVAPPNLSQLLPPRGALIGESAAHAAVRRVLADVDQRLRMTAGEQDQTRSTMLVINGAAVPHGADRVVPVEICRASEYSEIGAAVASQAVATAGPSILIVLDLDGEPGQIERLARANVSPDFVERVSIVTADLNERIEFRDRLNEAAAIDHLSIVVVRDGKPARFSLAGMERTLAETDRLGFEPRQWLIRPADEACSIRDGLELEDGIIDTAHKLEPPTPDLRRWLKTTQAGASDEDESQLPAGRQELDSIMRTQHVIEKVSKRQSSRMRVKVQPLLEQIEVIRTRPPAWVWRNETRKQLDLPTPLHAKQSVWRVHLAGWRGTAPGVATRALCDAGRIMGYEVSAIHDPTFVAAGCRAWSQVLFTRGSTESDVSLAAQIPYGEADVLLGLDWREALRSISPQETLQVADSDRTCSLVNFGLFQADSRVAPSVPERDSLIESLRAVSREEYCIVHDYAAACRTWFYTDRVTDLAMVGTAFQLGLIPVRLDAIEMAMQRLEASGYGRSLEAFQFGRWLAAEERLLPMIGRKQRGEIVEDLGRVTRRMVLSVRSSRWGGRAMARRFRRLLEQSIVSTPGLSETAAGRQAQRDMVAALYRCLEWGGMEYANRYGQLLMALYHADRGDKGRAITRDAVLPLAEAMLVRDQVYIACMATSPEQRRRLNAPGTTGSHGGGLNVKRSRGDRVERRYLTRLEFIGFGRRYRLDLRTSDWPARVAKASRLVLPHAWRGTRRDRELRHYMIDLVQRATHGCGTEYDGWSEAMHRLHHHAVEQRLRTMAVSEVRMLAEGHGVGTGAGLADASD